MFKEKSVNLLLFIGVIILITAFLQYLFPDMSVLDSGLITAILLTIFLKKNLYTILFGLIGLILTIVSGFYTHDILDRQQVIMQHLFSGIMVLFTMISVLYVKRLYVSMESDQQQLKTLFDSATEGIILTNKKGEIVLINPSALQLFQYSREELLGRPIETLIPGRFHHSHMGYREGFYKSPSNRSMGHGRDLFARKSTGQEFPVEVSLSYYKQKNEFYVIAFLVDITQRKEYEKDLIQQKEQLQRVSEDIRSLNAELETKVEERTTILKEALFELEKSQRSLSEALNKEKELNEIKSRFVSMASHEFRTPLSTVLSSATLVSKYAQADEQDKRERHIKRIKDSVRHLNDLLEDFLSLGKLEEGKILVKPEEFEIGAFLNDIIDEIRAIRKQGQEVQVNISGGRLFHSDKKLLKNILINLLSNAIKFSGENSLIFITASLNQNHMLISVKDQGIGIPEEDQKHMFSSFYRANNAVNIQGTGLGLHIVKRYADLINGKLSLQSELGKGTTVSIEMPQLPADFS